MSPFATSSTASPIRSGGTSEIAVAPSRNTIASAVRSRYGPREPVERRQPPLRLRPRPVLRPSGPRGADEAADPGCQTRIMRPPARRRARARAGRARRSRGRPRSSPTRSSCVPRAATRPWSRTTISSASAIVERRCAMITVVRSAHRLAQAEPDLRLGRRVDRRGRVVEDQDPRVDDERARDRDALALPARERDPALADHRVVALRQPLDELVRLREPRGLLDLLVASRRAGRTRGSRARSPRRGTDPARSRRSRAAAS